MKHLALFIALLFMHNPTPAQTATLTPGEYYLRGVMEVGSGFKFNADHSFNFFYAYGAIDREAGGTWIQQGDSLILNNTKKPPKDFKIVQQRGDKESNTITIRIACDNEMLLSSVYAEIKCSDTTYRERSNSDGLITVPGGNVKSIALIHGYWPDRFSVYDTLTTGANYFEFTIEKWIGDVDFDNFVLHRTDEGFTGGHPLLEKKEYTYAKSND